MKKNVLVVDDDTSVRKSLCKVLKEAGYEVMEAADGLEAVAQFESQQVDLLLLDIGLPLLNGWEILERTASQAPAFPTIIITGEADQYEMAVTAGVDALMEKPLDVAELLKKIQQLLAQSKEPRSHRQCDSNRDVHYIPPVSAGFQQKLHG